MIRKGITGALSFLSFVKASPESIAELQQQHDELLEQYKEHKPEPEVIDEIAAPVHHGKVLELDLHVKPVGDLNAALALLGEGKSNSNL